MGEQLDLLSWEPPALPADVLAFPQSRNRTRVRHVVDLLMKRRSQQSTQRCYDRELRNLAEALRSAGLSSAQIDKELDGFTAAVNLELWRRESRQRPGGAA